jgi:PhnB protein
MELNPYLQFDGTCAEAFRFYEQCLGGKVLMMMTAGESPMAAHLPPDRQDMIIHARLAVGDRLLMGSDAMGGSYTAPSGFNVTLMPEQPAEADRLFAALAEGGTISMPLQETFWAVRFGMLVDRFGTPWMINCERPAG